MIRAASCVARAAVAIAAVVTLGGCGEGSVTALALEVRPDNRGEFAAAQQAMLAVGCGQSFCHAAIVGNFKVTGGAAASDEEYQLAKAFVNLDDPEQSLLLRVALAGDPAAVGHPICFAGTTGCAWQVLSAWIRQGTFDQDQDGMPLIAPSELLPQCAPTPNACNLGGD